MSTSLRFEQPKRTFLCLPREIRDCIYKLAVVEDEPVIGQVVRDRIVPWSGLFLASRQVHTEASYIYYRYNTFYFPTVHCWSALFDFLHTIGPRNRNYLKHLQVRAQKQTMQAIPERNLYIQRSRDEQYRHAQTYRFDEKVKAFAKVYKDGCMDLIDCVAADCFDLLKDASSLTITMRLKMMIPGMYPDPSRILAYIRELESGATEIPEIRRLYLNPMSSADQQVAHDEYHSDHDFSTALPEYLEHLRSIPGRDKVKVVWETCAPRALFVEDDKAFHKAGWTMMKWKTGENLRLVRTTGRARGKKTARPRVGKA